MGLAEALSDDGELSGRGNPLTRGAVTGLGTLLGGMGHTLPFLITRLSTAMSVAYVVVVIELGSIAYIRYRYMKSPLVKTIVQVIAGAGSCLRWDCRWEGWALRDDRCAERSRGRVGEGAMIR